MDPLVLDSATTALVVIDLQKGIASRTTLPHAASDVVLRAATIAEACRAKSVPVFLVRVTPSPDHKDALAPNTDTPRMNFSGMPADWADIVPELGPTSTDHLITKRQWGAFYGTELDLQLRRRGIRTIILCGISTDIGVESTARNAYELGYDQVFAEDAMSSLTAEGHAASVTSIFPRIGRVRSTEQVLAAINA